MTDQVFFVLKKDIKDIIDCELFVLEFAVFFDHATSNTVTTYHVENGFGNK